MRCRLTSVLLVAVSVSFGLPGPQNAWGQSADETYNLEQGVIYGQTEIDPLTMNIATPAGAGPFACVVYVSWGGVASYNTLAAINAAQKGYVGVVIDYRRNAKYPVPAADVKSALRWIAANGAKYSIDPGRVAVVGFEFGAYLALMAAYTTEAEIPSAQPVKTSPYKIKAVVSLGAPTDWSTIGDATYYASLRGSQSKEDFFAKASPLSYVDPRDPPTLIFHGEIDKRISPLNGELLDKKLAQAGVPHNYILLKDQDGHIMEEWHSEIVWDFLAKYLK